MQKDALSGWFFVGNAQLWTKSQKPPTCMTGKPRLILGLLDIHSLSSFCIKIIQSRLFGSARSPLQSISLKSNLFRGLLLAHEIPQKLPSCQIPARKTSPKGNLSIIVCIFIFIIVVFVVFVVIIHHPSSIIRHPPSIFIFHHPPSSSIIIHHPSSIIHHPPSAIHLHLPSSSIILHHHHPPSSSSSSVVHPSSFIIPHSFFIIHHPLSFIHTSCTRGCTKCYKSNWTTKEHYC